MHKHDAWDERNVADPLLESRAPPPPLCATSNQMPVPDGSDITGEQLTMLFAGPAEHEAAVADVISGVGFVPK